MQHAMYRLIISNGKVVTPSGSNIADVAIAGERIAGIFPPRSLVECQAERRIDATGMIVMPGGIDPHVHMYWPIGHSSGSERPRSQGTDHVGRAALHGGTTTLIDFARVTATDSIETCIRARDADFSNKCPCDYAYHLMMHSDPSQRTLDELAEAIRAGYPTVKMFTTNILPQWSGAKIDTGDLWEIFQVLAKAGGLGVVHAEDDELVMHMTAKLMAQGQGHFKHLAQVHSRLSEDLSFRQVLRLAENVPGTALYMMHVSASTGVQAVREAQARSLPVYAETLPQYLRFTADDYLRPDGQIYHTYPSLKSQQDQDALWDGVADGTIQTLATDDICCSLQQKTAGAQIVDTVGGFSGVEPRIAVMYTEAVVRRGISLERFVDLVATDAARIMGLYPRKGVLLPGSDADIVILDPNRRGTLARQDLYQAQYSPWEGHEIHAWPIVTVLRGAVVMERGELFIPAAGGRYLHRSIPEHIRAGRR
ncbi:dihydroorotase [Peristeroidobacter soli]|uniref:dihydroorotase n=1 Tax=Peristeroidobacter soli TaxID=2497877 RepID=UPI00101C223A|nr:amidohydrolase family protein [Peristeroidobacter soli]